VRVVGADGTEGGWVVIALRDGRFERDYLLTPMRRPILESSRFIQKCLSGR
jgi:hypothetical protein